MTTHGPALKSLLADLRQHPGFPELLKAVETPQIPRFRKSRAGDVESARAEWIHQSGKREQHEMWLAFLTGKVPPVEAE